MSDKKLKNRIKMSGKLDVVSIGDMTREIIGGDLDMCDGDK